MIFLKNREGVPVVIDPVLSAKNGTPLIDEAGLRNMVGRLFPMAAVITPNIEEASRICGMTIKGISDMKTAAESLLRMGPAAVVIKGGHLNTNPTDILYDGGEFVSWERKRIDRVIHGTGCSFSSLLISFLALGYGLKDAFLESEELMEGILRAGYRIDKEGYFYMSTGVMMAAGAKRWNVIKALQEAKARLLILNPVELVPDVQMDLGYAVEGAEGVEDVAAFPGGIGRYEGKIRISGDPVFGVSCHIARPLLAYMRHCPRSRACANLCYDEIVIRKAKQRKMEVVFFDRMKDMDRKSGTETGNLDVLVDSVMGRAKRAPDIIYDKGAMGKEAVVRLFAKDPVELMQKMEMIRP